MHSIKKAFVLIIQDHTSFLVIRKLLLSIVIFSVTDKWSDNCTNWTKFNQMHVCRKLFYKIVCITKQNQTKITKFRLLQILLGLFKHKKMLGFKKMAILYSNSFKTFKTSNFSDKIVERIKTSKSFDLKPLKKPAIATILLLVKSK